MISKVSKHEWMLSIHNLIVLFLVLKLILLYLLVLVVCWPNKKSPCTFSTMRYIYSSAFLFLNEYFACLFFYCNSQHIWISQNKKNLINKLRRLTQKMLRFCAIKTFANWADSTSKKWFICLATILSKKIFTFAWFWQLCPRFSV